MRYIIGLGPGRCGTMSLAVLLDQQPDTVGRHETWPRLAWYRDVDPRERLQRLNAIAPNAQVVADVAFYYLPHLVSLLESDADVRAIVLHRDHDANVESIIRKVQLKKGRLNHWSTRPHLDESIERRNEWTECFPKHDLAFHDAVDRYIADYMALAREIRLAFPRQVKIFATEDMNRGGGVKRILDFCGYGQRRTSRVGVHENKGKSAP